MSNVIDLAAHREAKRVPPPSLTYLLMLEAEVIAEKEIGDISPELREECERVLKLMGR